MTDGTTLTIALNSTQSTTPQSVPIGFVNPRPGFWLGTGPEESLYADIVADSLAIFYGDILTSAEITALNDGLDYPYGLPSPISLLMYLWAYLRLDVDAEFLSRDDASGQEHNFSTVGGVGPNPEIADGFITPKANEFSGTIQLEGPLTSVDMLASPWTFYTWLRLATPSATGKLFLHHEGALNQVSLKWAWTGGNTLTFKLQAGYFAGHEGDAAYEYYTDIAFTGLTAPLNAWYFVAASYGGTSHGALYPVQSQPLTLRVNATTKSIPALCYDAIVPPAHEVVVDERFYIGPFTGRIAPVAIYLSRPLSTADLDRLWNNGNGLALPY